MRDELKFYRLSDATFYDCINTIYQFVKSFLDKKKCLFLKDMEPLISTRQLEQTSFRRKELSEEIAPLFCHIYQKSLSTGSIPDVWKMANVLAIFKNDEKLKASNYRPSFLTYIYFKMSEHIM